MTPKTATLKIDDAVKTLDADGKLTMDVDFDTKVKLVTELTGYTTITQEVTIPAEDKKVDINLAIKQARQIHYLDIILNGKQIFTLFLSIVCLLNMFV